MIVPKDALSNRLPDTASSRWAAAARFQLSATPTPADVVARRYRIMPPASATAVRASASIPRRGAGLRIVWVRFTAHVSSGRYTNPTAHRLSGPS